MIEVLTNDARVTQIRYTMLKEFDIDVTVDEETHNLNIKIVSEEDKQGEDTNLLRLHVDNSMFTVEKGEDIGEKLHNAIQEWFTSNYDPYPVKDYDEEFNSTFDTVWGYFKNKGLC